MTSEPTTSSRLTSVFRSDDRRLIAIALRVEFRVLLPADLATILPDSFRGTPPDAGDVIDLAGPIEGTPDRLHRARKPTPLVLERIRAIPPGGNRFDLPSTPTPGLSISGSSAKAPGHPTDGSAEKALLRR